MPRLSVLLAIGVLAAAGAASAADKPKSAAELIDRCRNDPVYCDETFADYLAMYAIATMPELANMPGNRDVVRTLRRTKAFYGVCLPPERVLTDDYLSGELAETFLKWAEENPDATATTPGKAVRTAMRAAYPCE